MKMLSIEFILRLSHNTYFLCWCVNGADQHIMRPYPQKLNGCRIFQNDLVNNPSTSTSIQTISCVKLLDVDNIVICNGDLPTHHNLFNIFPYVI